MVVALSLTAGPAAAATRYVWPDSPNPWPPYQTWATAAHGIQEAVDAAQPGDRVLVTNGLYSTGGRTLPGSTVTNRVAIEQAILVESVRGPAHTFIAGEPGKSGYENGHGDNAARCAYIGSNAVLSGFTLTNGHTQVYGTAPEPDGGGALCEATGILTNCILINNSAFSSGGGVYHGVVQDCLLVGNMSGYGGGAFESALFGCVLGSNTASYGGGALKGLLKRCTLTGNSSLGPFGGGGALASSLDNCLLVSNSCFRDGGGVLGGFLTNCTLVGNTATNRGGGAYSSTLVNCIVYYNAAPLGPNHLVSTVDFSCVTPLPANGTANIDAEPGFVNLGMGDYRLRHASPCIDAGIDFSGVIQDILGAPRVLDGDADGTAFADIGAYEYNSVTVDSDRDGATDAEETTMDTNPLDIVSCLRATRIWRDTVVGVEFHSSLARVYTLESSTNAGGSSWAAVPGSADVAGTGGTQTLTDTNLLGRRFYRIAVKSR